MFFFLTDSRESGKPVSPNPGAEGDVLLGVSVPRMIKFVVSCDREGFNLKGEDQ